MQLKHEYYSDNKINNVNSEYSTIIKLNKRKAKSRPGNSSAWRVSLHRVWSCVAWCRELITV